jgi:hypothetical protein
MLEAFNCSVETRDFDARAREILKSDTIDGFVKFCLVDKAGPQATALLNDFMQFLEGKREN